MPKLFWIFHRYTMRTKYILHAKCLAFLVVASVFAGNATEVPVWIPLRIEFDLKSLTGLRGEILILEIAASPLSRKLHLSGLVVLTPPYFQGKKEENGYSGGKRPLIKHYVEGPNTDVFFFHPIATIAFAANGMVLFVPNAHGGTAHKGIRGYSMVLYDSRLCLWGREQLQHGFQPVLEPKGSEAWSLPLLAEKYRRRQILWDSEEIWRKTLEFIQSIRPEPEDKTDRHVPEGKWVLHSFFGRCHAW